MFKTNAGVQNFMKREDEKGKKKTGKTLKLRYLLIGKAILHFIYTIC